MQDFASHWWPAAAAVILALVKVMNTMTRHWTDQPGKLKKASGFLVELLDIVRIPEVRKRSLPVEDERGE